jgi:ankyrin repeat protein
MATSYRRFAAQCAQIANLSLLADRSLRWYTVWQRLQLLLTLTSSLLNGRMEMRIMARHTSRMLPCCLLGILYVLLPAGCGQKSVPQEESEATSPSSANSDPSDKGAQQNGNEVTESSTEMADGNARQTDEANVALWQASAEGDVAAVEAALASGAELDARDADSRTALMQAALWGKSAVVKLLIEKGAEVNAIDSVGHTSLMFASTYDDPDTVKLLLDNGATVNARDHQEGFTALMYAAAEGHLEVVKLLLTSQADKTLVDIDGDTAADFARQGQHSDVVKALEK